MRTRGGQTFLSRRLHLALVIGCSVLAGAVVQDMMTPSGLILFLLVFCDRGELGFSYPPPSPRPLSPLHRKGRCL